MSSDYTTGNAQLGALYAEHIETLCARHDYALEQALGKPVQAGVFGADMQVALINDGPMTLSFEF